MSLTLLCRGADRGQSREAAVQGQVVSKREAVFEPTEPESMAF